MFQIIKAKKKNMRKEHTKKETVTKWISGKNKTCRKNSY